MSARVRTDTALSYIRNIGSDHESSGVARLLCCSKCYPAHVGYSRPESIQRLRYAEDDQQLASHRDLANCGFQLLEAIEQQTTGCDLQYAVLKRP